MGANMWDKKKERRSEGNLLFINIKRLVIE
jgi:hypothetical protein